MANRARTTRVGEVVNRIRRARTPLHHTAEAGDHGVAQGFTGRDDDTGGAELIVPIHRFEPSFLGRGTGGAVERTILTLPPSPVEGEPGQGIGGVVHRVGQDDDVGFNPVGGAIGVVAAEAFTAAAAEIEGRIVVAGM
jgi:hypothetical protein